MQTLIDKIAKHLALCQSWLIFFCFVLNKLRRFFSFLFYLCSITIYLAYNANCKLISFSWFSLASIAPEVAFMFAFCCTFKGFDYCLFIIFRMFVNFVDFSLHSPCTPLTLSFSFFFRFFLSVVRISTVYLLLSLLQ